MKGYVTQSLTREFSNKSIIAFILVLVICTIGFRGYALPYLWVIFAFIEVIGFFFFLTILSRNWANIPSRLFQRKIFRLALLLRLIWVVFSYFFFIEQTGYPFDFVRADSYNYHMYAIEASNRFWQHGLDMFFMQGVGVSDQGFPLYLTILYLIFGHSVIIPRITFALLSAWTCVLIYKIARRNFGEYAGRIAGIMAMLLPNFIYYTGLHLKETLMVFILVAFIERADHLLRTNKISFLNVLIIGILGTSMFFLRTVLAMSAIFALFSALMLSKKIARSWLNRMVIGIWFLAIFGFFLAVEIQQEIGYYFDRQDQQDEAMRFRAEREGGNKLATYGTTVIFLPFMAIAPFPTFVNIETQEQQMLLSGAYFVRNVYAFFVILSVVFLLRRKMLRKHVLLLSLILAYFFILAKSSFAISERFHLPLVPFLLVFAAYGISLVAKKDRIPFNLYLILITAIVIGWNVFKLAGRGIL